MSQFMYQQTLCALIEKAVNKALSLNINGKEALYPLEEKTLTVQLDELAFPLSFSIVQQQILVTSLTERSDCQLTSSFSSLLTLQKDQQITVLIKQEKLDIIGDIKVAQQFASLFENISIDWRSELATHIGDIPTYKMTQFGQWIKEKFFFAQGQIEADVSEWLVHEKRLLVTKSQLQLFNEQVTDTAKAVKVIHQRVEKLMKNLINEDSVNKKEFL